VRIIVTGGAGFIGSHIVDAYLAAGHEIVVLDNLWSHGGGRREHVPSGVRLIEIDVRDAGIADVFAEFRPEVVCHHAAQHSVAIGSRDPKFDADVNLTGLLNLLEAGAKTQVRKFVFASSGATYGEPDALPIDESTPQRPASPYGITKLASEHYLRFFAAERGIAFTALRYANVYGPRQDPNGEAGVISIFIGRFLSERGVRIDSDGEQTRDYVYVGDVARANVIALERGDGGAYCIGTNKRTSVNALYEALCDVTGMTPRVEAGPKRSGDVRDAQFRCDLAARELGWEPQISLLEGMRRTYAYFAERTPA